jgi:hypothetical protein
VYSDSWNTRYEVRQGRSINTVDVIPWNYDKTEGEESNFRKFCEWLCELVDIQIQEQWYEVNCNQLSALLDEIRIPRTPPLHSLLQQLYPQFSWFPWLLHPTPKFFWTKEENRKKYMDWLIEELNVETQDDLKWITTDTIINSGQEGILTYYNHSIYNLLKSIYVQFDWYPWFSAQVPFGYWSDPVAQREYIEWLAVQLGITKKEDWYVSE